MELYLDTANVAEVERLARIFPDCRRHHQSKHCGSQQRIYLGCAAQLQTPSAKKALYLRRP